MEKLCENCKYKTCINEWYAADVQTKSRDWFKRETSDESCECGNKESAFFGDVVSNCFLCTKYKAESQNIGE